ncbi:TIGR01777 family oxidoreductase [Rubrivirga litoralis]|uniref:TIGR01777 family oxidoreductase n=1 Tax=Rubrivirga litoralis TaxID=3075598 RepID=A0ABU3BT51_9BACT|nr:TIGR01777 family oxidoreductase [Rubrivirga sp. F394]MDT0632346.1 TIGR01777 family oxidoreductase [Rubrivirga sp. F394]
MPEFVARLRVPAPASLLFDWHERPGAFERLTPPWQPVALEHADGIRPGDRAVIRLGYGSASIRWTAEHRAYSDACRRGDGACQFTDIQTSGPFAAWRHTHWMIEQGPDASLLEDDVAYTLPLAPLSSAMAGWVARGQIERMFAYRHRVTREDVTRHAQAVEGGVEPMTVAITGSSGLIGSALAAFLTGGGHTVVRLVRDRAEAARDRGPQQKAVYWNVADGEVDQAALAEAAPDAFVHLAGEPVFGLAYTTEKKRAIWESRTKGTQLLSRALAALPTPPRVLVSASASGIYGDRGAEPLTEASDLGSGFLADVCRAWEASTAEAEAAGIRVTHARVGLVLSPAGGLLGPLLPATLAGLGGWPGDGTAYWPWIALDDVVYALAWLLRPDAPGETAGAVNLSAPEPAQARAFMKTLGATVRRPVVLRAPSRLVRALGGEAAEELALKSARMLPERLLASGFRFAYPALASALGHELGHAPPPEEPAAPPELA